MAADQELSESDLSETHTPEASPLRERQAAPRGVLRWRPGRQVNSLQAGIASLQNAERRGLSTTSAPTDQAAQRRLSPGREPSAKQVLQNGGVGQHRMKSGIQEDGQEAVATSEDGSRRPTTELLADKPDMSDEIKSSMLGKRKRNSNPFYYEFEPPYRPASAAEKSAWGGFCELESDPAIFNNVLSSLGVQGIKIQEVYSLDEELLDMLPKPVHGLIFLFQYASEADAHEEAEPCPDHVWFANQVVDNCCGTIALLNVVNNISSAEVSLSSQYQEFKHFTMPFNPAFRGEQVASCAFIKHAHNAYARQIDMWNTDQILEEKWLEGQKTSKARSKRDKRRSKKAQTDSAFHFVAYMPISNELWRMDGLESHPQSLGPCVGEHADWLAQVSPILTARMAEYEEDGVQFSLLAVVRDQAMAGNIALVRSRYLLAKLEAKLSSMREDWKTLTADSAEEPQDTAIDLTGIAITSQDEAEILNQLSKSDNLESLLQLRDTTVQQQRGLIQGLEQSQMPDSDIMSEADRALDRQNDYVPLIQRWLMMLAENQVLQGLVEAAG